MKGVYFTILLFLSAFSVVAQVDSTRVIMVGETHFVGNEKTKLFILERELSYQMGDTMTYEELVAKVVRSNENLFNTSLFNKVENDLIVTESNTVNVTYTVEERWYVWPYPVLENADRNFNTWWQTKDFERLTYGMFLNWNNFRGRNETFRVMAKVGFENQFSLGYSIPNLNNAKTLGLDLATGFAEYKEVNYSSDSNKRVFYKNESGPGRQVLFGTAAITYRKGLNFRHKLGVSYYNVKVDSAVLDLSTDYLKNNEAQTEYFTLTYYGKYDTRDYIEYPLKGYKVELYVSKYGFGLLQNEGLNLLTTTGGVYWHKPLGGRWYFANSIVGKLSFFDDPPYSLQVGLGYKNTVRGYELYVMDAQNYGIVKTNLKFALVKKKEMYLKWLPYKKFNKPYFSMFLNAYFDAGYADDELYESRNLLSNKWAYGYGIGLDVTAYYDFVMRLEYSFNRENENGFFLHFKKAI